MNVGEMARSDDDLKSLRHDDRSIDLLDYWDSERGREKRHEKIREKVSERKKS